VRREGVSGTRSLKETKRSPHPAPLRGATLPLQGRVRRMRKPKLIRSRDAMRARGMAYNASNLRRASSRHAYAGGGTGFGSIMLCDKSVARLSNAKPGMDISSFTIVPGFHRVGHFGPDPLVQPGLGTTFARRTGGAKRYPSSSASAEDERWVLQGLNPPYLRQSPQAPVVFDRRKIIFSSQAFSRFRRSPPPVKYGVDTTRADVLT